MNGIADFLSRRKPLTNEFFTSPGSRRTVLLCSHAGWTDHLAYALLKLGYNVLTAEPWDLFWTDDRRFVTFDNVYNRWVQTLRKFNVQLVIGVNATAMVPHPKTKELLHRAAGVPAVHYWCDEPRTLPPMTRRGLSAYDYLRRLRDGRTLNAVWDLNVCEEMRRFLGVENAIHVPLAASPEFWQGDYVPLKDRPVKVYCAGDRAGKRDRRPTRRWRNGPSGWRRSSWRRPTSRWSTASRPSAAPGRSAAAPPAGRTSWRRR